MEDVVNGARVSHPPPGLGTRSHGQLPISQQPEDGLVDTYRKQVQVVSLPYRPELLHGLELLLALGTPRSPEHQHQRLTLGVSQAVHRTLLVLQFEIGGENRFDEPGLGCFEETVSGRRMGGRRVRAKGTERAGLEG
jgi:hypothetical protein